ncbi:unnamed protein product [Paramecium pentaurelia]|uniref:Uncharacterized protein n=1 Tax=Paramecium pentaurelia TaxID=43138 RepID=A0A8S1YGU1_9CILI|nr:unnamed protein product [Paramecium pentaurelia]
MKTSGKVSQYNGATVQIFKCTLINSGKLIKKHLY